MKAFGITDKGKVRKENQDSFLIHISPDESEAILVLCDGMGGAQAGSVASTMAAETFMSHVLGCLNVPEDIRDISEMAIDAVNYTNIKVYDRSFVDFGCIGMGTTLVAAVIRGDKATVLNVGDSRCYKITDSEILQITRDHSLVEEMIDRGTLKREEAKNHPKKNVITRAMGVEQTVLSDLFRPTVNPGDCLLLCSDGLSNLVSDEEILKTVKNGSEPEHICASLMEQAFQRGANDNVTIVLLQL